MSSTPITACPPVIVAVVVVVAVVVSGTGGRCTVCTSTNRGGHDGMLKEQAVGVVRGSQVPDDWKAEWYMSRSTRHDSRQTAAAALNQAGGLKGVDSCATEAYQHPGGRTCAGVSRQHRRGARAATASVGKAEEAFSPCDRNRNSSDSPRPPSCDMRQSTLARQCIVAGSGSAVSSGR